MQRIALLLIEFYRFLTPFFKTLFGVQGNCRFFPSCSQFTQQVIEENGVYKGVWLGIKRVASCHPFHPL